MIKENITLLNALASDLEELGSSTTKFDEALNTFDTKTVMEFLAHYQETLVELLEGIQELRADIQPQLTTRFGVLL